VGSPAQQILDQADETESDEQDRSHDDQKNRNGMHTDTRNHSMRTAHRGRSVSRLQRLPV
jgi:hypothetical protein